MEIIAHRGASHDAPENTLPALQLAWDHQADAAEVDVYVSLDDHIVVIHDPDTRRTAGASHQIARSSLHDLRQLDVGSWKDPRFAGARIPTLEEVHTLLPSTKRLFVELKFPPTRTQAFVRACKALAPERWVLIGFSLEIMAEVKSALPGIETALVAEMEPDPGRPSWTPSLAHLIQQATQARLDALDLNVDAPLTPDAVQQIHDAGLKCYVWTCDCPTRARQLATAGIDGLTTNRPGWLRQQLARH